VPLVSLQRTGIYRRPTLHIFSINRNKGSSLRIEYDLGVIRRGWEKHFTGKSKVHAMHFNMLIDIAIFMGGLVYGKGNRIA
jgi:hypothetical protein